MGFLPKTMGMRPRLACEVRAEGVVAARVEDADGVLSAVERVTFANGASSANGAVKEVARAEKVAAVRKALDAVSGRGREVTLVVPDTSARVLLIDFDELPAKMTEALPVVRFRLKKLLPFDADDAAVSYQVMAEARGATQVLAVAMPREALAEYEAMAREAGYEPGAVLPSTLAVLAGLEESDRAALVVNAGRESVTTAIVKSGVLLLHRTIDLTTGDSATGELAAGGVAGGVAATAVAPEASARTPIDTASREASRDTTIAAIAARFAAMEGQTPVPPRAAEGVAVSSTSPTAADGMAAQSSATEDATTPRYVAPAEEIAQAVNVATAYFEDTLGMAPQVILSAGTLGADAVARLLSVGSPRMEEMVGAGADGGVPAGWLAGVRGALRS